MTSIPRQSHEGYYPVGLQHPNAGDESNLQPSPTMSYPPRPQLERMETSGSRSPLSLESGDRPGFPSGSRYDAERTQNISGMPYSHKSDNNRTSSWDLLAGIKKIEHSYEEFDSRNASQAHLAYADGDIPKNKVCHKLGFILIYSQARIVYKAVQLSLECIHCDAMDSLHCPRPGNSLDSWYSFSYHISRRLCWSSFPWAILPISPPLQVWGVRLLWWSIWLSVCWGGLLLHYFQLYDLTVSMQDGGLLSRRRKWGKT